MLLFLLTSKQTKQPARRGEPSKGRICAWLDIWHTEAYTYTDISVWLHCFTRMHRINITKVFEGLTDYFKMRVQVWMLNINIPNAWVTVLKQTHKKKADNYKYACVGVSLCTCARANVFVCTNSYSRIMCLWESRLCFQRIMILKAIHYKLRK